MILFRQRGLTLVELVISIVIMGVSLAGLLSVVNRTVRGSADPLIQQQALAVAEAYLEEIQLMAFSDPDGVDGEASRNLYDDVDDYRNLPDTLVRDRRGTPIAAWRDYAVAVGVTRERVEGTDMFRIDVSVTHPATGTLSLTGYRGDS